MELVQSVQEWSIPDYRTAVPAGRWPAFDHKTVTKRPTSGNSGPARRPAPRPATSHGPPPRPAGRPRRPARARCTAGSTARSARPGTGAASGTARRSRPAAGSGGTTAAASRSSRAFRKLTVPDRLSSQPASTQVRAISASDEKQWKITVSGAPSARSTSSTSASASRLWIISGLPIRLARSMCQANASTCSSRVGAALELARPVQVQAGLPDRHHPRMGGQPLDLGLGVVVARWHGSDAARPRRRPAGPSRRPVPPTGRSRGRRRW